MSAIRAEFFKTERPLYELTAMETREEWSTEDNEKVLINGGQKS